MGTVVGKRQLRTPARMIFLGPPGSGKGTLSARLIERFNGNIASLSSSEILRRHILQQTPLGKRAKHLMDQGNLLDDSTMIELVTSELTTRGWVPTTTSSTTPTHPYRHSLSEPIAGITYRRTRCFSSTSAAKATTDPPFSTKLNQSWVLDGFPRTLPQAKALHSFLAARHSSLNLAISIHVPASVILARIASRLIHPTSGRVYNLSYNPPRVPGKDDVTGEPLVRRIDDEESVWRARLKRYEEEMGPLEKWFEERGLVWRVTGETSDQIYPTIEEEVLRRFGAHGESTISGPWEEKELAGLATKSAGF